LDQLTVPIGRAFGENFIALRDGEIHITGPQVADPASLGKALQRTALETALDSDRESSRESSREPDRESHTWLATGDRAHWSEAEDPRLGRYLNFDGRLDRQVKFRGYRLELGEVETHARRCARRLGLKIHGLQVELIDSQLVAIFSLNRESPHAQAQPSSDKLQQMDLGQWKSALSGELPQYAVPQLWYQREDWPLTPSGKTDLLANRAWLKSVLGVSD
jgi:acyl-CoA synthetase (AMP-forming)/AMP-acid ligase II